MKGEYTEKVITNKNIIKHRDFITKDGEIVELADKCLDDLSMDIVNYYEQQEEKKKNIARMLAEKNEFKNYIKYNCGSFYFNFYQKLLNKIKLQYLTRFLYLCTFMDYDNRLVTKVGTKYIPIKENELDHILKLSRMETYNTKIELLNNNLLIIRNKIIHINPKFCKKGDIVKNNNEEKVRIFDNAIKELYELSTKTEHKKIAILFELLPYINLRWNIVCKNPQEEILECVKPYTIKEIMKLTNQTNITRFKNKLLKLTVGGENVIMLNQNSNGNLITINPKVYYKGTNLDDIKYLIGLFIVVNNNRE